MTTILLKNGLASKAWTCIDSLLGEHALKSGRFWYKGHQVSDMIALRKRGETIVHSSGSVRFKMQLKTLGNGERKGRLILHGWLKETPNATRIVMSILDSHSRHVSKRREDRLDLERRALADNTTLPEFTERVGHYFSVKADEARLEVQDRIDSEQSDRNFEAALQSHWYHKDFVSFCKKLGVKCYFRSVLDPAQLAS